MTNLQTRLNRLERIELDKQQPQFTPVMVREGETQEQAMQRQGVTVKQRPFPIIDEFPALN